MCKINRSSIDCIDPPVICKDVYLQTVDPATIITVNEINLMRYNIVVNTSLKAVVCIICHHPILPTANIPQHIRQHVPEIPVPANLITTLVKEFSLGEKVQYPSEPVEPFFGFPILEDPHHFCESCQCGYRHFSSFQSHQRNDHCNNSSKYHTGYGQLIPGVNRRIIEVDIKNLKLKKDVQEPDPKSWFAQGITPARDYSKIAITKPENESNLSAFFHSDGWLNHIHGYTSSDLHEARRKEAEGEKHGETIHNLSRKYLDDIQPKIQDNVNFGLSMDIGSTTL